MIEVYGNIWDELGVADIICITTNGILKSNNEAVCGRGVALEAAQRFPRFPALLGKEIMRRQGPHTVPVIKGGDTEIWAFPTKEDWRDKSNLALIRRSANELNQLVTFRNTKTRRVVLPRPGCANGGLTWEEVKPEIEKYLDDRFLVYELPHLK